MKTLFYCEESSHPTSLIPIVSQAVKGEYAIFWLGNENDAPKSLAQLVYVVEEEKASPEDVSATIKQLVEKDDYNLIVFPSTRRAKEIAPRLSISLKAGYVEDVKAIEVRDGSNMVFTRLSYGGAVVEKTKVKTPIKILTLAAESEEKEVPHVDGRIEKVQLSKAFDAKSILEERGTRVEGGLTSAEKIVAVGRGLKKKEDITLVEELAKTIGAAIGCTRPLAEDLKWFPKEWQVGLSGTIVKPKLYIALGISGQIQHIVGMRDSKTIVAINKDKTAPIFQYADYGIVGDLYQIVPELVKLLKIS